MNPELQKKIDECIEQIPTGRAEEIAEAVVALFNVSKDTPMAYRNAFKSALQHVKRRMSELAVLNEGGPKRLGAGGEGEVIDVLPPPSRPGWGMPPEGAYHMGMDLGEEPDREVPAFYHREMSDESQAIHDFIEQRAKENEGLPPEKPEVTIRALLNDLMENNLL